MPDGFCIGGVLIVTFFRMVTRLAVLVLTFLVLCEYNNLYSKRPFLLYMSNDCELTWASNKTGVLSEMRKKNESPTLGMSV